MDAAKNFAKGTLSTGYDENDTSIVLLSGDGAKFPAAPFNAVWWNATDYADPADDPSVEVVRVTAKATDTLTVLRGEEGTGGGGEGFAHNTEGKTYRLIAPLTAKVINEQLLDVTRSGGNYTVGGTALTLNLTGGIFLDAPEVRLNATGMLVHSTGGVVGIGDLDGNNTGVAVRVDDNTGRIGFQGELASDQTASASTPGTVVAKLPIKNLAGTLVGYIPIYGSIT